MPNRTLQQKALKLKTQRANAMLGAHKRHARNGKMLSKFSPKIVSMVRDVTPKATVPSYDPAMVQRFDMGVSGLKRH